VWKPFGHKGNRSKTEAAIENCYLATILAPNAPGRAHHAATENLPVNQGQVLCSKSRVTLVEIVAVAKGY
jgi:hypothetical protein